MIILGVDPGTYRTGVGIIESVGNRYKLLHSVVISSRDKTELPQRLLKIYHAINALIAKYEPDAVALENIFYRKNVRSMLKIGEARACAMLAASEHEVDVLEYPPAKVKQAVTGNGRASKEQMQSMIKALLNLKKEPAVDEADALAIAICHLHQHKMNRFKTGGKRETTKSLLARMKIKA